MCCARRFRLTPHLRRRRSGAKHLGQFLQAVETIAFLIAEALRIEQQIAVAGDTAALLLLQTGFDIVGETGLATTFQRSTALEATLLTFCPPGPPERTKVQENSSSEMRRRSLISSIVGRGNGLNSSLS